MSIENILEERLRLIGEGRKKLVRSNVKKKKKYCTSDNPDDYGAVYGEDCKVLYDMVNKVRPKVIIEIGTWFGTSAMILDKSCSWDVMIYTCDKNNVYVYDSQRVKYHNIMAGRFLKILHRKGIKADFVFMDGRFFQGDVHRLVRVCKKGATYITHDYKKGCKGRRNIKALGEKLINVVGLNEDLAYGIINN